MDALPVELFSEILGYLSPSSCKSARLTSKQFNAVLAKPTFDKLRTFIDPDTALNTLQDALHYMPGRPRAYWSPNCSVPAGLPIPRSFLQAMYSALGGEPCQQREHPAAMQRRLVLVDSSDESSSDESDLDKPLDGAVSDSGEEMTVAVMLQRLNRPEVNEDMLRQALFRYAIYKSYIYQGEGEAPQLWVMSTNKWKYQL